MDVRCERCSTEYELDDDSVPDAGCPVQCTTCGHTFTVTRDGVSTNATQPVVEASPSPPAADWLLETSDGRLHRFRNLTSLQKWIIERKVTREDKISRTGQAWRRLGEIVELAPFFDVVDEADRARAGLAGGHEVNDLKAEAQRARSLGSSRMSPVPARLAAPTPAPVARHSRPPTPDSDMMAVDAWAARGQDAAGFEVDAETSVVPLQSRGPKFFVAFVVAAALSAAAFFLLQRRVPEDASVARAPATQGVPAETVPSSALAPQAPSAAPSVAALPAPALPAQNAAAPAAVNAPATAAPVSAAVPPVSPGVVPPLPASQEPRPAMTEEAGPGYERILSDADRLLENGGTEKAFKLYERALKMRPQGVEALSGLGYVMLDKDRVVPSIGFFERALADAPSYGPALYGLGEALRANGDEARAVQMYRRYLQVNGGGSDAPAARRQLTMLEAKLKARAEGEQPASAPNTPPAGPPPSPSSVLNESATP